MISGEQCELFGERLGLFSAIVVLNGDPLRLKPVRYNVI